ncbi:hypothetical protein EYF80_006534 [Liparis tanakae]|uniref:Uncharacterized protein n=1 Tax=Liparis tanakae TaxID=230148 RepID=A0A4Z2IZS6_9TELE|nr:hypothetical protein EYF80_006534 [Liparis tanakae]
MSDQGHQLSLLHDGLELLAPLGARSHLSAEQIPGGQLEKPPGGSGSGESASSCSSEGSWTRCSSMRLACTLWIRLKKSSSGTVGAWGPASGGEQRWSSILEDCRQRDGYSQGVEQADSTRIRPV